MPNIKKQDIKDMVHQMISVSMESFDDSFNESTISEEDKRYAYDLFDKYYYEFQNKIKDKKYIGNTFVPSLVEYGQSKNH